MKLIEVYEGTIFQSQMVKNLLENEGIESFLKDEITGNRGGAIWRPAGGVKVVISEGDYDKAKPVIEKFDKSQAEDKDGGIRT